MSPATPLRVAFVPGVTPDKWVRRWTERMRGTPLELTMAERSDQRGVLDRGDADMCFVRLPIDQTGLHVIPLYSERPVVVAPKDHPVEAYDEVPLADLSDEILLDSPDLSVQDALAAVASGTGILIVPMSVARLYHRTDVVHRPVLDVEDSRIALAWRVDATDERTEAFVGIVRGRTARSSRS